MCHFLCHFLCPFLCPFLLHFLLRFLSKYDDHVMCFCNPRPALDRAGLSPTLAGFSAALAPSHEAANRGTHVKLMYKLMQHAIRIYHVCGSIVFSRTNVTFCKKCLDILWYFLRRKFSTAEGGCERFLGVAPCVWCVHTLRHAS